MLQNVCQPENNNPSSLSHHFNGWQFRKECEKVIEDKDITPHDVLVYNALLKSAIDKSNVWPSFARIKKETKLSIQAIRRRLVSLQAHNLILIKKRWKKNGWGNEYELDQNKIKQHYALASGMNFSEPHIMDYQQDNYSSTVFVMDTELCSSRTLNNKLIIKEKKIEEDSFFANCQNHFMNDEIPENYLEEAKKCYEISTDNTKFDDYLQATFKVFLDHRRKQEYQHTEKLLDYWRLWVHRDMVLAQKVERAKRTEERAKEKAEKPKKSTAKTTKTKTVPVEQPKTELEAVTEWQENYFDQIIACEKVDDLQPAMKEAVEIGGVVCGSAGCGKTTTATQLVKAFKEQNKKAEIFNWAKLYQEYLEKVKQDNLGKSTNGMKAFEAINFVIGHYKILVLDEIGIKPMTNAEKALFYRIVDERQKLGLPTTIITNYAPQHLKSPDGVGFQSFDRIGVVCGKVQELGFRDRFFNF